MTTRIDKLLQSAEKNLQKKQLSNAIDDYRKLIELRPKEVRYRQKLAEILIRAEQTAEALEQYDAIAANYSSSGFFVKAIAVYKQMLRIEPLQIDVIKKLARLNERQGLIGDALRDYRMVAEHLLRQGDAGAAIQVLESMRLLDPYNFAIRVKLAEICLKQGRRENGISELRGVFDLLAEKGDFVHLAKLRVLFATLVESDELTLMLARALADHLRVEQAVELLAELDVQQLSAVRQRQLADCWRQLQEWDQAQALYLQLLTQNPDDSALLNELIRTLLDARRYPEALQHVENGLAVLTAAGEDERLQDYYNLLSTQLGELVDEGALGQLFAPPKEEQTDPVVEQTPAVRPTAPTVTKQDDGFVDFDLDSGLLDATEKPSRTARLSLFETSASERPPKPKEQPPAPEPVPDDIDQLYTYCVKQYASGERSRVVSLLERLTPEQRDYFDSRMLMAQCYIDQQDELTAEAVYLQLLTLTKEGENRWLQVIYALGTGCMKRKEFEPARDYFTRLVARDRYYRDADELLYQLKKKLTVDDDDGGVKQAKKRISFV